MSVTLKIKGKVSYLTITILALLTFILLSYNSYSAKNVILYIGDGFGIAPRTAARMALGQGQEGRRHSSDEGFQAMALDKLKYNAMVTTHSLNSWTTDSAPGASVYACGKEGKIDNEFISMNPVNMQAIETVLEKAKKEGYAVGLVTTTRITHATPAAFASHIWNRDLEDYIAAQFISKSQEEYEAIFNSSPERDFHYDQERDWILPEPKRNVELDVILGGGSAHWLPKSFKSKNASIKSNGKEFTLKGERQDEIDLIEIAKSRAFEYINSRDQLLSLDFTQFTESSGRKLLGIFSSSHMSYEQDRQLSSSHEPMLAEMVDAAIKVLKSKSKKGFFLMVESGRIDHLGHANSGGLTFDDDGSHYLVCSDVEAVCCDGIYEGPKNANKVPGIYGSDYMIKEVLAFDYAIEEGRKLLNDKNDDTFIIATSDHECGGYAVVSLHDEADVRGKGTKLRTYAKEPNKSDKFPNPKGIKRGDAEIGGWFPEYSMIDFQGWKWPKAPEKGRRIVIAYGSNPLTNGNDGKVGSTPGNHTPQDVLVSADDNISGKAASKITGRGLLDNTDITPIIEEFLNIVK